MPGSSWARHRWGSHLAWQCQHPNPVTAGRSTVAVTPLSYDRAVRCPRRREAPMIALIFDFVWQILAAVFGLVLGILQLFV
jgi:hypothetical protein